MNDNYTQNPGPKNGFTHVAFVITLLFGAMTFNLVYDEGGGSPGGALMSILLSTFALPLALLLSIIAQLRQETPKAYRVGTLLFTICINIFFYAQVWK